MLRKTFGVPSAILIATTICPGAAFTAPVTYRTVVLSGDPAPGTATGVNFGGFSSYPVIDDAGHAAFRASLFGPGVDNTNLSGIWSEQTDTLALVARQGFQAPGTSPGTNFDFLFAPLAADGAGQVAFYASLIGPDVTAGNGAGIWSGGPDGLNLVARTGDAAPGFPAGVIFDGVGIPLLNSAGQTAFMASVAGPGVTSGDNFGVWSTGSGAPGLVARESDAAPGTPPGATFLSFDNPVFNSAGQTAFGAGLTGAGVDNTNNYGIWSEGGNDLHLVARRGDAAPDTEPGVNFVQLISPVINGAGDTAFAGGLTGAGIDGSNSTGIWSDSGGSLHLVARAGSQAPGTAPGVVLNALAYVFLNSAGQTAFIASLTGPGVDATNRIGLWQEEGGGLSLIVRAGSHAPGTPADVQFRAFGKPFLNAAGQIAFLGHLNAPNGWGIWATDPAGQLRLIVWPSQVLEVAPGDLRTVSWVDLGPLIGAGDDDGRPTPFSDCGQIVFPVGFTNSSSGVFVATVCVAADVNVDASVDFADVGPFVTVLLDPDAATEPERCAADVNGDSAIDAGDITPFLNVLLP